MASFRFWLFVTWRSAIFPLDSAWSQSIYTEVCAYKIILVIRIMLTLCLNNVNFKLALNKIFAVWTHSLSHKDCQSSLVQSLIVETIFLTSPSALLTPGLFTNVCFSYVFDAVPQLCQMVAFQKRAKLTQLKNQDISKFKPKRERESHVLMSE